MSHSEVSTGDDLAYQFFPVCGTCLKFTVRAKNDAHVALTTGPSDSEPIIEIFIGGWKNSKSAIRVNKKDDVICVETPNILNENQDNEFYLSWSGNVISLSKSDFPNLLSWENSVISDFNITHYGLSTGWGSTGSWKIACQVGSWKPASGGEVPEGAISGGFDNEQLYIARGSYNGALLPGKLVPSHGVCYVSWGGKEHPLSDYEVLCGYQTTWLPASNGAVPQGALPGGNTEQGETLYIARVDHLGTKSLGKVHPSHNSGYIPYGGEEIPYTEYEVLVLQ